MKQLYSYFGCYLKDKIRGVNYAYSLPLLSFVRPLSHFRIKKKKCLFLIKKQISSEQTRKKERKKGKRKKYLIIISS